MGPIPSPSTYRSALLTSALATINALSTLVSSRSLSSEFYITSAMLKEHTLQGMIELEYVRIGTEVMNSALSKLDGALTLTQSALDLLASLQNLHNQLAVTANSTFPLNFTSTGSQFFTMTSQTILSQTVTNYLTIIGGSQDGQILGQTALVTEKQTGTYVFTVHDQASFVSAYQKLASTYYGVPVQPFFHVRLPSADGHGAFSTAIVSGNESAYKLFVDMLKSSRVGLSALITSLSANTKPGDPNTLLTQIKMVYNDLPNLNSFSAVQRWAIDNYGGATASAITAQGVFQQHITNAITAAESTNTTQQEAVRRYMFVFEQYCQSAAAILTALNQLFDKISRGISG